MNEPLHPGYIAYLKKQANTPVNADTMNWDDAYSRKVAKWERDQKRKEQQAIPHHKTARYNKQGRKISISKRKQMVMRYARYLGIRIDSL